VWIAFRTKEGEQREVRRRNKLGTAEQHSVGTVGNLTNETRVLMFLLASLQIGSLG
jgi:hypothetical protein